MIQSIKCLIDCNVVSDKDRIPVIIEYEYERTERRTFDYPGSPENYSIISVTYEKKDIVSLLTDDELEDAYDDLVNAVMEQKRDSIDYIENDIA